MSTRSRRRVIRDLEEMHELWPALFRQMKQRFGVEAARALFHALPSAMTAEEVVLEFDGPQTYQEACAVAARLPIEAAMGEYMDRPRKLRLRMREPR